MSALADIVLDSGFKVGGSDRSDSELTQSLAGKGAYIYIGQKDTNFTSDIDVFVYTAAIHKDHPEFAKALELGIPILTRAELLGQMMRNYKLPIAVSGTHGKTTVTSMVSEILMAAETDPTLLVGGILDSIGGNIRIGHSEVFVTEACEYTNSFLSFFPKASVILNVELITGGDIEGKEVILKDVKSKVITFGKDGNSDYYPTEISFDKKGISHFVVNAPGFDSEEFTLKVPGRHNIMNACAAIALCDYLNVDRESIKKTLAVVGGAAVSEFITAGAFVSVLSVFFAGAVVLLSDTAG